MNRPRRKSGRPDPGRARERKDRDDARILDPEGWIGGEIDLVQHDDLRAFVETGSVRTELGVDRQPLLVGIAGCVDDVHEHPRALEVREELVSEPDTFARPLDQPWHVRDDELAAVR